jgi:hypothetical protein
MGKFSGKGRFIFGNLDRYEGDFKDGRYRLLSSNN